MTNYDKHMLSLLAVTVFVTMAVAYNPIWAWCAGTSAVYSMVNMYKYFMEMK